MWVNAEALSISIPVDGNDYAIAILNDGTTEFPLNFSGKTGEYTLSIETRKSFDYLHLIDLQTGNDIDLLRQPTYTFNSTGNDAKRFRVKFSQDNSQFAYQSGDQIIIIGTGTLQVFDILGRKLFSHEVNSQLSIPNSKFMGTGVYILRLDEKSQKIVIR